MKKIIITFLISLIITYGMTAVALERIEGFALNPFAYNLSSKLSEDGATLVISYSLNDNAIYVEVQVLSGKEVVKTIACEGITKGSYTIEVPTDGLPQGIPLTWSIKVGAVPVKVPTENPITYSFYGPYSVDIDNNPENPTFGLILTNESMQKVKNIDGYHSTGYGAGIYAFNAAFEPISNGGQPGFNGGISFAETLADGSGTAYAPYRVRISDDGRIFVTSLNTDGHYLWELNPENLNEWTSVFQGTLNGNKELTDAVGRFMAAPNAGFDVRGSGENLKLLMLSGNATAFSFDPNGFKCAEYNLGTATSWTGAPSRIIWESIYALVPRQVQVQYDAEGGIWFAQYRGTTTEDQPGLVHWTAEGVEDFKWLRDMTRNAGIRFNSDFTKLIVAGNNGASKKATIYAVSKDANGAPVLTEETVIDMASLGNNINDFAWDYAGNLYGVGSSNEKIVAWAMPYSGEVVTPAASQYTFQVAGSTPEIEWIPMELDITNLTTSEIPVGDQTVLQLIGRNDMMDSDVMLFLNNYTGEEKAYEVNAETSFMTFGGLELTVMDGSITKSVDSELGDVYAGVVHAFVEDQGETIYVEFALTMFAQPAIEVEIEDATITINEESAIAIFSARWEQYYISIELGIFEEIPFKEYPHCIFYIQDIFGGTDIAIGAVTVIIEDGVVTLEGVFTNNGPSQYGPGQSYHVTCSGNIPIKEDPIGEEYVTACDSYEWNGQMYTESGEYVYTTIATNGSDSVVTLHLTINKTQYAEASVVVCDSYLWNGQTYTQSGDYTYNTIAANGCDSIVTLHLTINQSEVGATEYATICYGETYTWNGQTYSATGEYNATLSNVNGCDSTAILNLTVLPEVIRKTEYITAPTNKTVTWRGKAYNETGQYYDTIHFVTNMLCDSIIYILDLTIGDNIDSDRYCGENLTWYYSNGTLVITGSGVMYDAPDLLSYRNEPWYPERVNHVVLPNTITHIGNVAFADCANLTNIVIPSSVTSIGDGAFSWTGLQSVIIPASVTDLGEQVFETCNNLRTILYEGTPSSINNQTVHPFIGCVHLDTIITPAELWHCTTADPALEARYGVPNRAHYIEVTDGELTKQAMTYIAKNSGSVEVLDLSAATNTTLPLGALLNNHRLSTLYLPDQIEVIPEMLAEGCYNLLEILIPATVTEIGNYAFAGCTNVWRMTVEAVLPPTVYANTFDGIDRSISLIVPAGSEELYRQAEYWKEFFIENTNNQSPKSNCQKILHEDHILILREGKVYNVMGVLVE